jgi:hypothetical protein
MLEADGGEEEVADLDEEAHDPTDPQAHHLAGEEEEEDRVTAARERPTPPRRRSTPGRRRGSPGNTKTAPAAELTSSTVTPRERRRRLRGGRRRGISRPWISPREKRAQKFHRSRVSFDSAWPLKNETLARFARARGERQKWPAGGWLPTRGLVSNTLKWPSWAGRPFGAHIKHALSDPWRQNPPAPPRFGGTSSCTTRVRPLARPPGADAGVEGPHLFRPFAYLIYWSVH